MTKVKLNSEELYPYYNKCRGGPPDFDLEIPTELWERYQKSMFDFFSVLKELKIYLKDN